MSHFYGWLTGGRSSTTRTGTKSSGMVTKVQDKDHAVQVKLFDRDGVTWVEINRTTSTLSRNYSSTIEVYCGPIADIPSK